MTKPRARDLGLPFPGTPGPLNAITDVPGVEVGFCTLTDPAQDLRTGVTAILPRGHGLDPRPVRAGHYALNGNGEMTAVEAVDEAVINAIVAGVDVPTVKPKGKMCRAIDRARLSELFG